MNAVTEHGMKYFAWNASTRDAELCEATPDQLYRAAVSTQKDDENIILLSHDTTNKTATVDALKLIISHYKSLGYAFSTL